MISKKNKIIIGIGILVVGGVVVGVKRSQPSDSEGIPVVRRDVVETVQISGRVESNTVADLGFDVSGLVKNILVQEGEHVVTGQQLVILDLGTLIADLNAAEADVAIKKNEASNTQTRLKALTEEQNTSVASAYAKLLSDGLSADPDNPSYTQDSPEITGRYVGQEGIYRIRIEKQQSEFYLYTFGLERVDAFKLKETTANPLGTQGLFITFPDSLETYADTVWTITIPNKKSSLYSQNYNAYEDALRERDRVLQDAEAELRRQTEGTSIADAELLRAQASVQRIQAQIAQRILKAPFDGIVRSIDIDLGESVSSNNAVVSLISTDGFGVEVDLPEIDSVKVHIGDTAMITLDPLKEESFSGTVVSVNRAEKMVSGVPVYQARIAFDTHDDRIASGMTATVTITTDDRENVLALPARAIRRYDDGRPYVVVLDSETKKEQEVPVTLGLLGSDSFFEIVSGVVEGMQIQTTNI